MTPTYESIAAVLRDFADEHGLPNAISPAELAALVDPVGQEARRLAVGRILTSERIGLNRELAKVGLVVTSYASGSRGSGKLATIDRIKEG